MSDDDMRETEAYASGYAQGCEDTRTVEREQRDELLGALERTLSWLTSYPGGGTLGPKGPYEQARAAIAAATGDSRLPAERSESKAKAAP